jgi:hypothetical protein
MKKLIIALCLTSSFSIKVSALQPTCFSTLAQAAKDKIESDASQLYRCNPGVTINSVNGVGGGTFLLRDIPEIQFSKNSYPEAWQVKGSSACPSEWENAKKVHSVEGSRITDDVIIVYIVAGTCEVVATRRDKDTGFVGCNGGCPQNSFMDTDAYNGLYKKSDAPLAAHRN